jgi:hypothetical protein
MKVWTATELDDKAKAWLAEKDETGVINEWLLVRQSYKLYMVILYKRASDKGVYALQKLVEDFMGSE